MRPMRLRGGGAPCRCFYGPPCCSALYEWCIISLTYDAVPKTMGAGSYGFYTQRCINSGLAVEPHLQRLERARPFLLKNSFRHPRHVPCIVDVLICVDVHVTDREGPRVG